MARADPLKRYNEMRDFKKTREPKGVAAPKGGNSFVVQKHDATRLHWDFRLELDGVLKSWAVTKGPSLNPDDKRLAVRTEDHPMAYGGFEGTIPADEYGGGTVMLWDRGSWEPLPGKDPLKTIEEGHLHFFLHGARMKGEWLLVRIKPRPGEKRENWLLRKIDDDAAGGSGDLVDGAVTSVATGRSMAQIARGDAIWHSDKKAAKADPQQETKGVPRAAPSKARKGTPPAFRAPQLATLVDAVPEGRDWFHEVKYDGYRAIIAVGGGKARAYTRTGLDWSDKFGSIVDAFAALDLPPALIDGEVVALDDDGKPNFGLLQDTLKTGGAPLAYFAFDLLAESGKSLAALPNLKRKDRLRALLDAAGAVAPIHFAEHVSQGEKLFEALCAQGYEGIISKRADGRYTGKRSRDWLKVKCNCRQEFVIIGWTESDKARGFRSLLLGTHKGGTLHYAGKVGTGFTAARIDDLLARLAPHERQTPPAEVPKAAARGAHWVTPKLVAEIAYAEFTAPLDEGGVLRHPSFLGLRDDKSAACVEAEVASDDQLFGIAISNPDRLVFPEAKITKGDLAAYYAAVAEPMLRYAQNRPLSLVRCPQGRAKHCFFQKHDAGTFGDAVRHLPIREKDGGTDDYLFVQDGAGLIACVQMGAIEFHGWGSPASDIEHPDRVVFDLDPDIGLDFGDVRAAAAVVRDELAALGLASEPMLSGGKGVHVIAALDGSANWDAVKDFASRFARALAEAQPALFTANIRKAERKGRIFLDWLRNQRGATAVMPFSVRARSGAPVAMPLSWSELDAVKSAATWSLADTDAIVRRAQSATLGRWQTRAQSLPDL